MSELEYDKSSHQWAWEKGLKRKCPACGAEYDPKAGHQCHKKEEKRRLIESKEHEERKRKLRAIFDNVIWPDQ